MKMLAINPISLRKRVTEFLFDYLFILAYLVFLFVVSMLIYIIFFNGVPEFTEIQSQWLVFFYISFANHAPVHILRLCKKMGAWGREKRDLSWSTRKKQFRLA